MNANPNVQALLDNSEELLQPLRKKGIKVLLDILGNHRPGRHRWFERLGL